MEAAAEIYKIGDYVVYGNTGVCRVEEVISPGHESWKKGFDKTRSYYRLKPLYQTEIIYTPTDNDKVFMRPVISKEEAEELIDMIPAVRAEAYHADNLQDLKNHYRSVTEKYECSGLIELTMSIYEKKKNLEQNKRKLGEVDGKFMRQAEEMLFGELAVALGIDKKDVQGYIAERVEKSACKAE